MTSACSRWSQPPKIAISNWNGSTREVYARLPIPCGTLRVRVTSFFRLPPKRVVEMGVQVKIWIPTNVLV